MDIKQVKAAVTVAEAGSFSVAAGLLSYSVSAVSKQVAALEGELGIRLFERRANAKVSRTEECEGVLPFLRRMLEAHDGMRSYVRTHFKTDKCVLVIGTAAHVGATGLEEHLAAFLSKYPGVTLHWILDTDEELLAKVMNRTVDIAMTGRIDSALLPELAGRRLDMLLEAAHVNERELEFVPFYRGELMIALSAHHPAIRDGVVGLGGLQNERFLFTDCMSESGPKKHEDFRRVCRLEGFEPQITEMYVENSDIMMGMVANGSFAVPLMRRPNAQYDGVEVCRLEKIYYTVTNHIYYRRTNESSALRRFVRFLRERTGDM